MREAALNPTYSQPSDLKFEIGHVLFIDIVGYSKLNIHEQSEQLETLKAIVRGTGSSRKRSFEKKLLRLPRATVWRSCFELLRRRPALCAIEIANELKKHPEPQSAHGHPQRTGQRNHRRLN